MKLSKKYTLIAILGLAVAGGAAATSPPKNEYRNLKVLPRNISEKELSRIMIDEFEDGLGVGCSFCHAEQKGSHKLDYASDEKPEKEIARHMIKMTMGINHKYFKQKNPQIGDPILAVNCVTCHKGQPHPSDP